MIMLQAFTCVAMSVFHHQQGCTVTPRSVRITETSSNSIEKDIAVQAWLEDLMSIFMKDILYHFKGHVFHDLKSLDQIISEDLPPKASNRQIRDKNMSIAMEYYFQRPYFTLDQRIISEFEVKFTCYRSRPRLRWSILECKFRADLGG